VRALTSAAQIHDHVVSIASGNSFLIAATLPDAPSTRMKGMFTRPLCDRIATGVQDVSWELKNDESPRACLRFFSAASMKVHTEPQTITMDKAGKMFYATSLNPTSALSVACEREAKK